ncbi:unnamed protein product [Durusdinium trenchii]|uniref:Helicase ATP-binding domain-containing protein n=1 Tax=Durusdinium trenchii TaxID=1381693 RepID=A0ABP0I0P8_9DINO
MAKNWRRGHIVGLPVAGAADDKEWVPKWTVQCNKDLEKFESTFLMHTVEPIDKLLKEVGKDNLSRMLEQHLPKGVDLDVMFASRCRLENGHAAFAVNVRVPHVKAIHMLRDQVLCGDLEAELNRSLADIHQSEFQVQVDKTEFFEQYESSLLSLSKLTHHQESKLRQLHQRKSKELHLTAPAGAGKTFVAVQFALDKVYENCKSEGAILYVAPRLSLCLHFVQWLIARHLWLKGRGGELEELLSRIVIMHKRDEDYVNVKLVLEGNQFAEHPAAAPEYLLAIFDEAHELFTTDEMTGIYRDLRANQKLLLSDMSQSASLRVALPEVEDTVSLSDVVRSTQRIVAAAQAFELEKSKGITTSCSGTNGPPLKTFIFEALDDAEMFHQCCRYTLDAIRHVFRSYPSLSSLHLRVAIIVPDKTFCDKFKGLLRDELTSTFTARKFQLRSFAESLRYLRSHHHDERAAGDEVLVLDTVEEARGQEMMVVICVGLDQKIADTDARKTDTLLTRARIYQGITRAQLMAIVVDKLIQGGFLQFLTTLKFNNKKFDQSFAFSEGTSKAASRIKKKAEALPSEVVEEKDGEGMDTAAMTGLSLAVVKDELGGIEQLLEVCIVKENDDGANKFISADGKAQGEIDKDGPRDDDRFETSIWDTDSNQTKSTSQTLAFDPRIDQVLGRILEELPGGESTPGLEARKEIDHTDGKSQAGLARYFEQKYKQGGDFEDEEYERDVKDWCWVHKPSGIKVWQDAIDLSQSGGSGHCVFHYTTGLGFRNITNTSSKVAEVFASLITAGEKANALWGAGVYTVRKTPDEWPSIESLLDNMYRNMLRRDIELKGHEHAGEVTQLYASRVAYCIPIIADAAILYDVSVHPTPEMVEQGRPAGVNLAGKLLNEPGKPVRSVIVVRVENEEENYVSNAYANLLPTLRTRARAVAARLGTKHAEAHSAFGRLATVLGARGAFREAERLWRQILEAKELELGAEHADTLACANNLAGVFRAQQKVDEAEPLYRRALSGFEAMAGTMHPYALACANNLAILLKDQGKLDEAEVLHRQTLELCESQLGEAHLDTLYALNNLAVLLGVNGKLKEAEALSRRALGFRQSLLGEMHPETLISWSSLDNTPLAEALLEDVSNMVQHQAKAADSSLGSSSVPTPFLRNLPGRREAQELRQQLQQLLLSPLGDSALLAPQRCIELLQSAGCSADEALELIKEKLQGELIAEGDYKDEPHISTSAYSNASRSTRCKPEHGMKAPGDVMTVQELRGRLEKDHLDPEESGQDYAFVQLMLLMLKDAEITMLQEELKEAQAENEMLKKQLEKAEEQVEEVQRKGATTVTLHITLKDQPAVVADTGDITYHGNIRDDATKCVISFPGKYPSGWGALVKEHHGKSVGCVFLCTPEDGLGTHEQDPDAEDGSCYCKAIYGERGWKELGYLKVVKSPCTEENMLKEKEKAKPMDIVVVAEIEKGQELQVVFFAGQKGEGKVHWDQLATADLWDGKGLGGSQKGEVAFLEKMWRETKNPAWRYEEVDVMQFLQNEFQLEQEVDARDKEKNCWRRGRIVGLPDASQTANDSKWVAEWTVECNEHREKFKSTHLMHTTDPIDKLIDKVGLDNLQKRLEQNLPYDVDVQLVSRTRLEDGDAALEVEVHVPHVKAIHMLRDQVLGGDLELQLNGSLLKSHDTEFEVQVDKTEFMERYERSLSALSKLTKHQESKLRQLHMPYSKEIHMSAPAGAGKTFVAVLFALDKIYENWDARRPILYIAPRPCLGLHFVHWLVSRHECLGLKGGNVQELLTRIVVMHKPYEKFVKLTLQGNRLVEEQVDAPEFALVVFDEAHELFSEEQMMAIHTDLQADQKLLLSDISQSAALRPKFPHIQHQVSLDEVVRSTKRIVAAAQAFELEKNGGVTTSCCGTNGPPLKTFMFETLNHDKKLFDQYSRYTIRAIWHVCRTYPTLRNFHRRIAIIVPDNKFLEKFQPMLQSELSATFTARNLRVKSFEESLRYLHAHHHHQKAAEDEVIVMDTIEEARGQEMMVVICVGLDEEIADTNKTDTLLTRAHIYQGITRAQLMAIVVDKLVQGGWLQFLATLKFNKKEFDSSLAFGEDVAAADPTEELRDTSEPDRNFKMTGKGKGEEGKLSLTKLAMLKEEEEEEWALRGIAGVWGSEDDGAFLSGDFLGECWLPPLGSLTAASKRYVLPLTNAPPETGHLIVDASWTFPSETVPPLPDVKREEIMHTGSLVKW